MRPRLGWAFTRFFFYFFRHNLKKCLLIVSGDNASTCIECEATDGGHNLPKGTNLISMKVFLFVVLQMLSFGFSK